VNFILVCDNARIHQGPQVERLCEDVCVMLIYLPPYCPELNPIELCFAAMKSNLQNTQILSYASDPE
jgi:transposase